MLMFRQSNTKTKKGVHPTDLEAFSNNEQQSKPSTGKPRQKEHQLLTQDKYS